MKIIQFTDSEGRPAQVRTSSIVAVLRSGSFVKSGFHPHGGYSPAILLLEGGHQVETNTDYETIVRTWADWANHN